MSNLRPSFDDPRQCGCGGATKIIETRRLDERGPLVRRRECRACGFVAITYELSQGDYWQRVRLRNFSALRVAAAYLAQEADRLKGVPTPMEQVHE